MIILKDVIIFKPGRFLKGEKLENYKINSDYDYDKINSLFKNFDTMSFLETILNY